jgi:hypothetical protein
MYDLFRMWFHMHTLEYTFVCLHVCVYIIQTIEDSKIYKYMDRQLNVYVLLVHTHMNKLGRQDKQFASGQIAIYSLLLIQKVRVKYTYK